MYTLLIILALSGSGKYISTTKYYNEYKYNSKFIKFVDKWHEVLFGKK